MVDVRKSGHGQNVLISSQRLDLAGCDKISTFSYSGSYQPECENQV